MFRVGGGFKIRLTRVRGQVKKGASAMTAAQKMQAGQARIVRRPSSLAQVPGFQK
jgi:hypothetical protein